METLAKSISMLLVIVIVAGCGSGGKSGNASPATPALPTDTATLAIDATATQSSMQTANAQVTTFAESTRLAQETEAVRASATARYNVEATIKAGAKATYQVSFNLTQTAQAEARLTETADKQATATAKVARFEKTLDMLVENGVIIDKQGQLEQLKDFDRSMSKLYYWDPEILNYEVENFVFAADLAWASASNNADWLWSGCGVAYGIQDPYNYTVLWVALDGNVYATHSVNGNLTKRFLTIQRWGKASLSAGTAKLVIAVVDKRLTIYVDDVKVAGAYDGAGKPGDLALLTLSGTNKDFGTRCKMTNIYLLIIK